MEKIRERVIAYILALCTLVSAICTGITMPVSAEEEGTGTTGILSSMKIFTVKCNDENLTEDTVLKDGDELEITLEWFLSDDDRETNSFEALITPLENVIIPNMGPESIIWQGISIGTYKVDGGKLIITIDNDTFLGMNNREGGATIKGKVAVNGGLDKDGEKVPVQVGDYRQDITYKSSETESSLGVWKRVKDNRGVEEKDGKYYQTFLVDLSAYNGEITLDEVDDKLGNGFKGSIFDLTIVEYPSSKPELAELLGGVSTLADLNKILKEQSITIPAGEKLTIEYTVEVSEDIYKQNGGNLDYNNTFSAEYTTNAGKEGQHSEHTASASANRPTVEKTGTINEKDHTVEWTIKVDLKDWAGKSLEKVVDELGSGLEFLNGKELSVGDFHETEPGVWVATYTTHITDDVWDSPTSTSLSNTVKVTVDGNDYEATGSVQLDGHDWVTKEATEYDPDEKLITWKITLHVPETPISNVKVEDFPDIYNNHGQHEVYTTIYVDGECVVEDDIMKDGNGIIDGYWPYGGRPITFQQSYIDAHKGDTITIIYQTKVTDDSIAGKIYRNKITLSYTDDVVGPTSQDAFADWKQDGNALTKEGMPAEDKNAIDYTLAINLDDINGLKASGNIVITDELPSGLTLDINSVKIQDLIYGGPGGIWGKDPYWNDTYVASTIGTKVDGNTITFTIPVDQHTLDNIEYAKTQHQGAGIPYIHITYTATVDDPEVFTAEDYRDYKNTAEATYNGKEIGSAENTTRLTPKQVVVKEAKYDETTKPDVLYTIKVNPDALKLSDEGWLEAKDSLGSALNYDLSSIKVERNTGGDSWEVLTPGTQYMYSYIASENALKFRLPDEAYLRITYAVKVNLAYVEKPRDTSVEEGNEEGGVPDENNGKLTPENSYNRFQLTAFQSAPTESGTYLDTSVLRPNGWAAANQGSVTIEKYYTDENDQMVDLNGAIFKLEKVVDNEIDPVTLKPKELQVVNASIKISDPEPENIGKLILYNLDLDQIYVLTEISAPDGYVLNKEPYYFVIPGSLNVTLPSGLNGHAVPSGGQLLFENRKATAEDLGSLTIQKTVAGELSWDKVADNISFTVVKDGEEEKTWSFSAADIQDVNGNVGSYTITGLEPGTYTVTETVTSPEGYTCSTTYTLSVGENGIEDNEASVSVEPGQENKVYFTNTYTRDVGSLTLTKTIEGGPVWDAIIKAGLTFVVSVKGSDGQYTEHMRISGSQLNLSEGTYSCTLNNLPTGEYKIEEIISGSATSGGKDYVLTTVTYQVGEDVDPTNCTTDKTASGITINKDERTDVTFNNIYAANEGKLILRKKVEGIPNNGQDADAQAVWDAVKDSLTFEIWKQDVNGDYQPHLTIECKDSGWEWKIEDEYAVLELIGLPVGTYQVVEKSGTLENYSMEITGCEVFPPDNVIIAKDNSSAENIEVKRDGAEDTTTIKVTFTNTYISNDAEIQLEKKIEGILDEKGKELTTKEVWETIQSKMKFVIRNEATGAETIVDGSGEWKYNEENDSYVITVSLTAGTYTVREEFYDVKDHTWKSVSYTVKVGESTSEGIIEDSENITIPSFKVEPSSSDVLVSLCNIYEHDTGTLKLTKNITGLSDDVMEGLINGENISFTVVNVDTEKEYPVTFKLSDFEKNEDGTYTYTLIFDGKEDNEEMLPVGRYTITESDFSLKDYQMEVSYKVTPDEARPEEVQGPEGIGKSVSFIIKKDRSTEVIFTNSFTKDPGELTLQKTVSGDLDWDDVKDTFSIVIDYDGSEGDPKFPMTIEGKDSRWNRNALSDNVYTLTLEGLEPREYTVTETFKDEKTGYTRTTTYTVNNTDSEQGVTVTVTSNTTGEVDIENKYSQDKGKLVITKTIAGLDEDADAKNNVVSTIKFVVINTDTKEPVGEYYLSAFSKDEQSGLYTSEEIDLPVGNYTVEETEYTVDDYIIEHITYEVNNNGEVTLVTNGGVPGPAPTVVIENEGTTTIHYVDTYEAIVPDTGKLLLQKIVGGDLDYDSWEDIAETLSFEVKDSQGKDVKDSPFAASDFTYNDVYKAYVLEIPNLTPGEYTVKELINGKVTVYTCSLIIYTKGSGATTGLPYDEEIGVKVDVSANEDNQVVFTNTYTLDKGNLKITKTVESDVPIPEDQLKAITFTVTNGKDYTETFTLASEEFNYDEPRKTYTLTLENLPVGDYTVTETHYDMDGFVTESVTYQINSNGEVELVKEDKPTGQTAPTATVEKGQTATIAYKDVYKEIPKGSLVIEKIVNGLSWEKLPEYISFTVTGPNGYERTITADEINKNKNGNSYTYTIDDLEMGEYTITENITQEEKGYTRTTSYVVGTGDLTEGKKATVKLTEDARNGKVTFYNDYEQNKGSLQLTKVVTGLTADELSAAINAKKIAFVIKNKETNKEYPYILASFTPNGNGSYILKLEGENRLPEGDYVIIESNYDLPNYKTGIRFEVRGGASGSGNEVSIKIDKDTTTEVTITNTYTSIKGSLVIQKRVNSDSNDPVIGWDEVKDYLTFVIKDEEGKVVRTISPKVDKFEELNGIYSYTVTDLDAEKTYTVTETSFNVPDYNCTVFVTGEGSVTLRNSNEAMATVSETVGTVITFTNTYKMDEEEKQTQTQPPVTNTPPPPPASTPTPTQQPPPTPSPSPLLQVPATPSPSVVPEEDGNVLAAERSRSPQTGDYFFMWLTLFLVSLSALIGYLSFLNRKNRKT